MKKLIRDLEQASNYFVKECGSSSYLTQAVDKAIKEGESVWVIWADCPEIREARCFSTHRPIPKTIPLNLDADVVENAEKDGIPGSHFPVVGNLSNKDVTISWEDFSRLLSYPRAIAQAAQGEKGNE